MKDRYVLSMVGVGCLVYLGFSHFMVRTMVERREKIDAQITLFREKASQLVAALDGFPEDVSEADWYLAAKIVGEPDYHRRDVEFYKKIVGNFSLRKSKE